MIPVPILLQCLLILHVVSAMLWFGSALSAPRAAREMLDGEPASTARRVAALRAQGMISRLAAALVFATGLALELGSSGGFAAILPRMWAAIALSSVWLLGEWIPSRATLRRIAAAVESGQAREEVRPLAKRLSMIGGIQHLLFSVVLILMLWRL